LVQSVLNQSSQPFQYNQLCQSLQQMETITLTHKQSLKSSSQKPKLNIGQPQQTNQQQEAQQPLMLLHQLITTSIHHHTLQMFLLQQVRLTQIIQLHHQVMDTIWVTNQQQIQHQLMITTQLLYRQILKLGVLLLLIPLQLLINDGLYPIYLGF